MAVSTSHIANILRNTARLYLDQGNQWSLFYWAVSCGPIKFERKLCAVMVYHDWHSVKCRDVHGHSVQAHVHYNYVIISTMASEVTSITIVYSIVYSGTEERKHQRSVSLAFVRWINRWPVNSPHKGPITRKMFPFDDVIMLTNILYCGTLHRINMETSIRVWLENSIPMTFWIGNVHV